MKHWFWVTATANPYTTHILGYRILCIKKSRERDVSKWHLTVGIVPVATADRHIYTIQFSMIHQNNEPQLDFRLQPSSLE